MSINYHIVPRKDPRDASKPTKYYAEITNRYVIDFDQVLNEITDISSVSIGDTYNVLYTLSYIVKKHIQQGRIIDVGELGRFYLTLQSNGVENPDELDAYNISKSMIRFRASKGIKEVLNRISFRKHEPNGPIIAPAVNKP